MPSAVKLGGRYEILEEVGSSGLVRAFRATDTENDRTVILRTMQVTPESMEQFVRFHEEGAVIALLEHPNIWGVHRVFIDGALSVTVLEDVAGRTLAQVLRTERLLLWRTKLISLQIASALAYGHEHSVIHRELEPNNVFIANGDHVKLRAIAELGRERVIRGAAVPSRVTNPHFLLYASPEQRAGRTVGRQTDIYSLGALMYHMVNGYPPYDDAVSTGSLAFRDDVPEEWRALIARAMARSERYRMKSAIELGMAIETLPASGEPPMRFDAPLPASRCPQCGREGRGTFCSGCGVALNA